MKKGSRILTATASLLALLTCFPQLRGPSSGHARAILADETRSVDGMRRIDFVRAFASERDVNPKRSFWSRLVDVVAGPPTFRRLVRPYSIATDAAGRILVTDPGALTVHVFDFERKKYAHLDGAPNQRFESPIGVAVDGDADIYVTDSRLGLIFVFDARGKFRRYLGEKRGEGLFKRPTDIAIDPREKRIYLTDTIYNKVFTLDLEGNILHSFGSRGADPGQFNYPTGIALHGEDLIVMDTMNFRIQIFDRKGVFRSCFGSLGDRTGTFNRPKGVATDSEGNLYVTEGLFETVQVFNEQGRLLYYFGNSGAGPGEFQLPAGLWIDARDRIYVADSYNQRVQEFRVVRVNPSATGVQ